MNVPENKEFFAVEKLHGYSSTGREDGSDWMELERDKKCDDEGFGWTLEVLRELK